jgi:hypothetical protein
MTRQERFLADFQRLLDRYEATFEVELENQNYISRPVATVHSYDTYDDNGNVVQEGIEVTLPNYMTGGIRMSLPVVESEGR